jgi:uncharacterized protein
MSAKKTPQMLVRLGELQALYPWRFVIVALLSLIPAIFAIVGLKPLGFAGLGFKSDFSELLPDNRDSVIEMRRVSKRLSGSSTLTVVIEIKDGKNKKSLEKFVDNLVPKLKGMGPEWVGAVDYGVHDTRAFFEDKQLYFVAFEDLKKAHDDIAARYDYEVSKQAGWNLLDDSEAPPPLTAESLRKTLKPEKDKGKEPKDSKDPKPEAKKEAPAPEPYPDGYYMNPEGTMAAILIRTSVSGDKAKNELQQKVKDAVASLQPATYDPTLKVSFTGNLITSAEEYNAIINDLMHVSGWGLIGVLGSVLLFFLRVRTVFTMGATILVALLYTFGLTRFTIGYLNSSTGFLVSIIAGNGINYGIMYMARYIEARRDEHADVAQAIALAHRDSWLPTLAGSLTAMLAYGSLMITDFRGFKHFGIISGYGMLICWLVTYALLPAILAASERVLPSFQTTEQKDSKLRGYYGVIFAKLAQAFPKPIAIVGVLLGLVSVFYTVKYITSDPMEYDMGNVRNERKDQTAAGNLSVRVDQVVGRMGQDGMAIMTDRLDQVPLLEIELQKRYDEAPKDLKPFENVVTIYSLLPKDQKRKLPLIKEMREHIQKARKRGFINDKDWKDIQPYVPHEEPTLIGIPDLPEQVARPFTEKDGTRGRIVYIVPKSGFSVWDAHYLIRWAKSFRYTKLPTGEVIKGSGSSVIFADMIQTVVDDAPKAIAFSALGSILVILLAFRFHRHAWGVFLPWLLGICGLITFLYFKQIKLNFLNFVTLPITIGIGAEYAHNLMQRYRSEGPEKVYRVVVETGGAVILCSLTTTIGYFALTLSINHGIVSFGLAAGVGEITCILAAVLILPAFLFWSAQRMLKADKAAKVGEKA